LNDLPRQSRDIDLDFGSKTGGDESHPFGDSAFANDPRAGIVGQKVVDDGIADLVTELVRMAFRDGFGSEYKIAFHNKSFLLRSLA